MPLTDAENMALGFIGGSIDVSLLQSTNYWKNAAQQGLPFTLNPLVLYRGYLANLANNGFCVSTQFLFNGLVSKGITGGIDRPLTAPEKITCGTAAGVLSGVVCGPIELVMIQQQRQGLGFIATSLSILKGGASSVFRGTTGMCFREGIYCGGYLGIMPVVREQVQRRYPESFGKTEDGARFCAALIAGPINGVLSHPPDTLKTCLQGDLHGVKFTGYGQSVGVLVRESGVLSLWRGYPWRLLRQMCALFIFDKVNSELSRILFPHAFKNSYTC